MDYNPFAQTAQDVTLVATAGATCFHRLPCLYITLCQVLFRRQHKGGCI